MEDGQEAGEGQAQWREQHRQKSASDINLPIQETERRPAQYSSLANTRGACYISHPSGKKEVSLLENSVPSSGSTNLNASEWRVRLPWRPSPHGLAGNLNCGSLLWAQGKPKNTGVSSLFILQQIFQTQESNRSLWHCRWILYTVEVAGPLGTPLGLAQ